MDLCVGSITRVFGEVGRLELALRIGFEMGSFALKWVRIGFDLRAPLGLGGFQKRFGRKNGFVLQNRKNAPDPASPPPEGAMMRGK